MRLGYRKGEITVHGFRSSFSTITNESGQWHPDAIERQLAHAHKDAVRGVYDRAEHWPERAKMMQWYADRLDDLRDHGQLVLLKASRSEAAG